MSRKLTPIVRRHHVLDAVDQDGTPIVKPENRDYVRKFRPLWRPHPLRFAGRVEGGVTRVAGTTSQGFRGSGPGSPHDIGRAADGDPTLSALSSTPAVPPVHAPAAGFDRGAEPRTPVGARPG